ncbi:MAG: hypothetical protein R2690_07010 [Acidimicrobiales bacterium]
MSGPSSSPAATATDGRVMPSGPAPAERVERDLTAERMRSLFLGLGVAVVVGTVVELAFLRHWTDGLQFGAWAGTAALGVAVGLAAGRPTAGRARAARLVAGIVALVSLVGTGLHLHGNYEAGPLDRSYGERWDAMSLAERWWAAATGAVGPAPALASGVLIIGAACVFGATIGRTDDDR